MATSHRHENSDLCLPVRNLADTRPTRLLPCLEASAESNPRHHHPAHISLIPPYANRLPKLIPPHFTKHRMNPWMLYLSRTLSQPPPNTSPSTSNIIRCRTATTHLWSIIPTCQRSTLLFVHHTKTPFQFSAPNLRAMLLPLCHNANSINSYPTLLCSGNSAVTRRSITLPYQARLFVLAAHLCNLHLPNPLSWDTTSLLSIARGHRARALGSPRLGLRPAPHHRPPSRHRMTLPSLSLSTVAFHQTSRCLRRPL